MVGTKGTEVQPLKEQRLTGQHIGSHVFLENLASACQHFHFFRTDAFRLLVALEPEEQG